MPDFLVVYLAGWLALIVLWVIFIFIAKRWRKRS